MNLQHSSLGVNRQWPGSMKGLADLPSPRALLPNHFLHSWPVLNSQYRFHSCNTKMIFAYLKDKKETNVPFKEACYSSFHYAVVKCYF